MNPTQDEVYLCKIDTTLRIRTNECSFVVGHKLGGESNST